MDHKARLDSLIEKLSENRTIWTEADYKRLTGKDSFSGRMLGFLTRGYRERDRLWKSGRIVWGYVYRTYTDRDFNHPYLAWVLFSPQSIFEGEPELYEAVLERLTPLMEGTSSDKDRKLKNALDNPVTEAKYYQLPEPYAGGKLIYISTTYVFPDFIKEMSLGVQPLLIEPGITKEVALVAPSALDDSL